MRLIFFGSDKFSVVSLKALFSYLKEPSKLTVVTRPNCPVFRCASEHHVTPIEWPFKVPPNRFDLGIVVSFGYMMPTQCIENCSHGMVNVHPSLLPRWRGPAPLVHTLLNHDRKAGVCLITVAKERFDTGSIIHKEELSENPQNMEYSELHRLTANVGASILVRFLDDVEGGLKRAQPQSEEGATKAPKVVPSMAVIDWERTVVEVDCLRRAVTEFEPLTTNYDGTKIKVSLVPLKQSPPDIDPKYLTEPVYPGSVVYSKRNQLLAVRCADGWIWVESLLFPGRRRLSPKGFFAGYLKHGCKVFSRSC